jgi:hypothetical protein
VTAVSFAWWLLDNYSWRVYIYACASFYAVSIFMYFFLHESPRWLILRDRYEEAFDILNNVAHTNGAPEALHHYSGVGSNSEMTVHSTTWAESIKPLFDARFARTSAALLPIWLLSIGLVYYGIVVITPSFFSVDDNEYLGSLISCFAEVVGFFGTMTLVNYVSRIHLMMGCSALATVFLFIECFFLDNSTVGSITLISARMFAISLLFIIYLYTLEYYPTSSRNTALGLMLSAAKFGNIAASFVGEYAETSFSIPFITVCIVLAFFLIVSLPVETKDIMMPDRPDSPRRKSISQVIGPAGVVLIPAPLSTQEETNA